MNRKDIHTHHIIPRHMGGLDYDWNLGELNLEDHYDAHRRWREWCEEYEVDSRGHQIAMRFLKWEMTQDPEELREVRRIASKLGLEARYGKDHIPMTPEERRAYDKKYSREYKRKRVANETQDERAVRLAKRRRYFANLSPEKREIMLAKKRESARKRYANRTPLKIEKDKERYRKRRQTPEHKEYMRKYCRDRYHRKKQMIKQND